MLLQLTAYFAYRHPQFYEVREGRKYFKIIKLKLKIGLCKTSKFSSVLQD